MISPWSFAGAYDLWVLKLRQDGNVEWQKTYGGSYDEWAYSVQQNRDGGYIVAGWTQSFGKGDADLWVLKLRPGGNVEWQKTYEGLDSDFATSVQQSSDGGYIVAGETKFFSTGGEEISDLLVLKLGPEGTIEWQKNYGGIYNDWADSIQQTSDGGYIVAGGTTSFGAGAYDFLVLKLRTDGSLNPSCNLVTDANIFVKNSNAAVKDTSVSARDSNANSQGSLATVQDTKTSAYILCPP